MDRAEAERLVGERSDLRRQGDFAGADEIRHRLRKGGWEVRDAAGGAAELVQFDIRPEHAEVPIRAVTVLAVAHGWQADLERWLLSVFSHCKADFEALVVDNSGDARLAGWLAGRAAERFRFLRLSPPVGFATAVNAGIVAAAGGSIVLFDPGVELTGDAISPLVTALSDPTVAIAGPFGLRGQDSLKEFTASSEPEVDALEGYCVAFRREDALAAGGFDPRFRFYRIADIEFSFRLRDRGGKAITVPDLPLIRHEHRMWEAMQPDERQRLSRRNLYRFLDRWGDREDLLLKG